MNFKKIVLSGILATAGILGASEAGAVTCTATGLVTQIWTSGATTYVYINPSPTVSYYSYLITTNTALANALLNSLHKRVSISSTNLTTCPTNATGSRYYGNVSSLYIN